MADKDLSDYANSVYFGGPFYVMWREAGDTSHQAGYILEEADSTEETKLCTTSGNPISIAAKMPDVDTDTSNSAAGDAWRSYPLGIGTICWLRADGNASQTFSAGTIVKRSSNTAGLIEVLPSYSDGTAATDGYYDGELGRSFFDEEGATSDKTWNRIICSL